MNVLVIVIRLLASLTIGFVCMIAMELMLREARSKAIQKGWSYVKFFAVSLVVILFWIGMALAGTIQLRDCSQELLDGSPAPVKVARKWKTAIAMEGKQ